MEQSKCASKLIKKTTTHVHIAFLHIHMYLTKETKKDNQQQKTLNGLQNNRTCANIYTVFIQVLYILSVYQINTNIKDHNDKHVCTHCPKTFKHKSSLSRHEHQDHNEIHTCKGLIRCDTCCKCDTR